jgi:hypothetical protein
MYPAHAAAPTAADRLNYLLPVVVEDTQEDPTLEAVEATPGLLLLVRPVCPDHLRVGHQLPYSGLQ